MINELDQSIIFELSLQSSIEFHLQRATIITWNESSEYPNDDRAISFQDLGGVNEVWRFICKLKGTDFNNGEGVSNLSFLQNDENNNSNIGEIINIFPEVTRENVPFIAREMQALAESGMLNQINEEIMDNNCQFIRKLGEIFDDEEKNTKTTITNNTVSTDNTNTNIYTRDMNTLSYIFVIFKNIFLVANRELIELLVNDELYNITFGALEYDIESTKKCNHRNYFKEIARFKNVLNIEDAEVIKRIHINHRLAYLRDTAIGRFIEELPYMNINVIIQTNNAYIVQYFLDNKNYLEKLISNLNKSDITENDIVDNLQFVLELISCMKEFQQKRVQFHETLVQLGILDTIELLLQKNSNNKMLKNTVIEILVDILSYVPYLFKEHIIEKIKSSENQYPSSVSNLLFELCDILTSNRDFGIKYEISKIIISLLDNEVHGIGSTSSNSSGQKQKHDFYSIIFDNCLNVFVDFLSTPIPSSKDEESKNSNIGTKQIIIEILCDCLNQHGSRIQYWLIQNNVLTKILDVLNSNQKILHLQVVKYIKSIILNNDYNFTKVIMNTDCFGKIVYLFNANKKKNNLIFSAILDLFQMLKNCSHSKKLLKYLFENYYDFIYDESNKVFFEDIIAVYENQNDFGIYNNTVSHINKEGSEFNENVNDEGNDLSFIGLFSKAKADEIDFDFDNENSNNFISNGDNLFMSNKRNSEEKLDELIKDLKKENEDNNK